MAQYHRVNAGSITDATLRKIVNIGTADTDGGDAHLNFSGSGRGSFRRVDQAKGAALVEFGELQSGGP